jgi:hypothetical protein
MDQSDCPPSSFVPADPGLIANFTVKGQEQAPMLQRRVVGYVTEYRPNTEVGYPTPQTSAAVCDPWTGVVSSVQAYRTTSHEPGGPELLLDFRAVTSVPRGRRR